MSFLVRFFYKGVRLIVDDAIADKMLRMDNIPKHLHTYAFLKPIIGKMSIVTVSGDYWKKVRRMFLPPVIWKPSFQV